MTDALLPAQEELLEQLVRAAESVPRVEQEFTLLPGADQGPAVVVGAGVHLQVLRNDIWTLDQAGFLIGQWNMSTDVPVPFTVTRRALDWFRNREEGRAGQDHGPYFHVRVVPIAAREKLSGPLYALDLSEERLLLSFIEPFQQNRPIEWGDRRLEPGDYLTPKVTRTAFSGEQAVSKIRANMAKSRRVHSVRDAEEAFFAKSSEDVTQEYAVPATSPDNPASTDGGSDRRGNGIFVVHGHQRRDEIARHIEKTTSKNAIILDERAGRGRTLIEKVLDESQDAAYAVVLMTADDEGRAAGSGGDLRPRARQNAVLELGFFIGYLGRDKVAVLYDEAVELPSDMRGVEYIALTGNWKHDLAVELEAAGIPTKVA